MKHRVLSFIICGVCAILLNGCLEEEKRAYKESNEISDKKLARLTGIKVPSAPSQSLKQEFSQIPNLENIIDFIESNAELPKGVYSIGEYHRYYAINKINVDDDLYGMYDLVATFREGNDETPNQDQYIEIPGREKAYFVSDENMPRMFDGGCSEVTIFFDTEKMEFLKMPNPFGTTQKNDDLTLFDGICNGPG